MSENVTPSNPETIPQDRESGAATKCGPGNPPKHTQFKKGVSGNPGGMPKSAAHFREKCREAAQTIVEMLKRRAEVDDLTPNQAIEALPILADRGGYLTSMDQTNGETLRLRALVSALSITGLNDAARAEILADYKAREEAAKEAG